MFCKSLKKSELAAQLAIGAWLLAGLLISGCVEVVDGQEKTGETAPTVHTQEIPEYDGWIESGGAYRYKGVAGVPHLYCWQSAASLQVRFEEPKTRPAVEVPSMLENDCDRYVFSGTKVMIGLGRQALSVEIPVDVVFTGARFLSGDAAIEIKTPGRIFMRASTLSTGGRSLLLSAAEIHFEQAVLQNFSSELTAPDQRPGRDGGDITIQASKVTGRLFVDLRGQRGGRGPKGENSKGTGDSRGGPGQPGMSGGASGNLVFDVTDAKELRLETAFTPGAGGEGGFGGDHFRWGGNCMLDQNCPAVPPPKPEDLRGDTGPLGTRGSTGTCRESIPQTPRLCS